MKINLRSGKLSFKIIIGFIILGILITTANCIIGYYRYTMVIEKIYNDKAYDVAHSAMEYIDNEKIEQYFSELRLAKNDEERKAVSEKIREEEDYKKVLTLLSVLRDNMGVNYVYVADLKDRRGTLTSTLTYLLDADKPDDEYPPFVPGDTGPMNESYREDLAYIYENGVRSDSYFYSHSAFGYNMSAIVPLKNADGKVVGILGVEISMENLQNTRLQYVLYVVLFSTLIATLVIIGALFALRKMLLNPINLIVGETRDFVSKEATVSDKLGKIKTGDEIETLAHGILKMEEDIHSYIENITSITAEKERIGAELTIATKIQLDMLPSIFPPFPDRSEFDIYATMQPAKEVGGDFYDFFLIDNDHLGIVIADVSGKGVPAALFMVIAKTLINNRARQSEAPCDVFTNVNNQLLESNETSMFVTAWLGVLEISTGKLTYTNAGHNAPLMKRADGSFEYLEMECGFVLAGMPDFAYTQFEMTLEKGDILFLYTDGVTETINPAEALYGEERLRDTLNSQKNSKPEELLVKIKEDIDIFAENTPQFDDITMLAMKIC